MKVRIAALALGAILAFAVQPAQAQSPTGEPDAPISEAPGNFSIGIGAAYGPSYEGSDNYTIFPAGILRADLGSVTLTTRGTYLYADLLDGDAIEGGLDLEAGPIAGVRLNRTSDIKDRRVRRLGEIDAGIELGGFVGVGYKGLTNPYDRLGVRVELVHDVADAHGGFVVSPSIEFQTPLSTSIFVGASLSAEFASEDYADAYFSITPAGAARSGLSAFDADGGYKNWGASLIAAHSLSGDLRRGLAVFGLANYKSLQNDFERSPIVSQAGDSSQWFGALGISYTF